MPRVYLSVDGFKHGGASVTVSIYPSDCTVSIVIGNYKTNKHEEYNFKLKSADRAITLKDKLESGDYIDATAEHEGWRKSNFWQKLS